MSRDSDGKPYEGLFRDRRSRRYFWEMFIMSFLLLASIAVPIIGSLWDARNSSNRLEETAGILGMPHEKEWRDNHRKERPVTILVAPIQDNKDDRKNSNATEYREDNAICVSFDNPIQIRVFPGDVDQSGISGAIKRKD